MSSQGESQSSTVGSSNGNIWPLHKISEPHEWNDVLLIIPEGSTDPTPNSTTSTSDRQQQQQQQQQQQDPRNKKQNNEPPIPWRSTSIELKSTCTTLSLRGNQRFSELLRTHQDDYESRTQMEKPLVAVRLLQLWRSQNPPGRFLTVETNTNPPLWKDIGDKKARAKISKALKHLCANHHLNNHNNNGNASQPQPEQQTKQQQQPTPDANPSSLSNPQPIAPNESPSIPSTVELNETQRVSTLRSSSLSGLEQSQTNDLPKGPEREESKIASPEETTPVIRCSITQQQKQQHDQVKPPPLRCLANYRKPEKFTRRISEQLHSAQEDGSIYGRWSERDQLMTIYERQKQKPTKVDLVLISGELGVGKTSLAKTLKYPFLSSVENNDCGYGSADDEEEEAEWPFFLHGKFEHSSWRDPNAFLCPLSMTFASNYWSGRIRR